MKLWLIEDKHMMMGTSGGRVQGTPMELPSGRIHDGERKERRRSNNKKKGERNRKKKQRESLCKNELKQRGKLEEGEREEEEDGGST